MPDDRTIDLNTNDDDQTLASSRSVPGSEAETMAEGVSDTLTSPASGHSSTELPQKQMGPYHLVKKIGEGGMGLVYEAEQFVPLKRKVALKMVRRGMATEEFIARFESERQALAMMDHPNIARVLDAGATDNGQPFFVMEYVDGVPLNSYCDEHKLGLRERLNLFVKICEGVQHAHQKAIIHRDLKPSNVLVTTIDGRPVPKIIDFGVVKVMDDNLLDSTLATGAGQLVGTPEYMSPEQADLDNAGVDTRTDVYALGVLLYELLVGQLPFTSANLRKKGLQEVLRVIKEVDPPKPSTLLKTLTGEPKSIVEDLARFRATEPAVLRRSLRGDLDWITMMALEKDKALRYQTANALAMDIRRHLEFEPVRACPPSRSYRIQKFVRRNRIWVVAASFVMLAVMLGIAGTTGGMIRAVRAERHAQQEAEAARQVSDFLVDLFEVADPDEARGNTITAREILDMGSERIETELQGQPATQARLMNTIGNVYRNLGLYEDAAPKLESALDLLKRLEDGDQVVMAGSLADLADLYIDLARYPEAEQMLHEALALNENSEGLDGLQVAESLSELASVYRRQGRFDEAEPLYERARRIRVDELGPNHPEVARSYNGMAILNYQRGRYEESERLYSQALKIWRKAYGSDHSDVAKVLNNLALLYHHQDLHEEALPLYKEAAAIYEKVLGADHPRLGLAINNLALVSHETGRHSEAEKLFLQALAIREKSLGPDHPDVAQTLNNLANHYRDQGQYEKAAALYERALGIREATFGPEHPDVAWSLRDMALLDHQLGRSDQAQQHFEQAVQVFTRTIGENHPDLQEILADYAQAMRESGRSALADSIDQKAHLWANQCSTE